MVTAALYGLPPWPVTLEAMGAAMQHAVLADGLRARTARMMETAVNSVLELSSVTADWVASPKARRQLARLAKSLGRLAPCETHRRTPVTMAMLQRVHHWLARRRLLGDPRVGYWLMVFNMAHQGALRVSEYTANLQLRDIAFVGTSGCRLTLRSTKTGGPSELQYATYVHRAGAFDVVSQLRKWCAWRAQRGDTGSDAALLSPDSSPPFSRPLTRLEVTGTLKRWLVLSGACTAEAVTRVSSHSLRHGFATDAVDAGFSSEEIALIGRWKSDVRLHYIHATSAIFDTLARFDPLASRMPLAASAAAAGSVKPR